MKFKELIETDKPILMEAAIVEVLRRNPNIQLHPELVNAPLIYTETGQNALKQLYNSYIDIAKKNNLPIFLTTPTWRTNKTRVYTTGIDKNINQDAVQFLKSIREEHTSFKEKIKIGGLIGCKNDCYKPEEGLTSIEAAAFHEWQINQLVEGGVDYLIAETLPNLNEALGIAKALEKSTIPYFISFVINRNGYLLDGNSLSDAVNFIDQHTTIQPLGYVINCAYPTFLNAENLPVELFKRLIGFNANASSLDHCDLDNASELKVDSIQHWGDEMVSLHKKYEIKMLGGCCGTGTEHLNYLIDKLLQ